MPEIESKDFWDLRDLAELATECVEVLTDEDGTYDEEDRQDAREVLGKLAKLAQDLGQPCDPEEGESVSDALESAMGSYGPTLISEAHFVDAMQQDMQDFGYLSPDLPAFISNNINWEGVAEDLKHDYTSVTFDGEDWYIR